MSAMPSRISMAAIVPEDLPRRAVSRDVPGRWKCGGLRANAALATPTRRIDARPLGPRSVVRSTEFGLPEGSALRRHASSMAWGGHAVPECPAAEHVHRLLLRSRPRDPLR